jgi:pimeloyl-ACP methyl ester carboxylesterase
MKRRIKKIAMTAGIILAALIIISQIFFSVLKAKFDEEKTLNRLRAKNINPIEVTIPYGNEVIHSIQVGNPEKPKVLLIHGSPGYWMEWENVMSDPKLLDEYCLITFDRAGYGKTTVPPKNLLSEQANVAASVMRHFSQKDEKFIVVGHSYGGGVASQVVLDYPELVSRGVFSSSTLSPELQHKKWYNRIADINLIQLLIPNEVLASNDEMISLESCLRKNENRLKDIYQPIQYIQGTKDVLVPFETVNYLREHKPQGIKYWIEEGMNHFVPFSHPHLIINAIRLN